MALLDAGANPIQSSFPSRLIPLDIANDMLARCPKSKLLKEIAQKMEVSASVFRSKEDFVSPSMA